MKRKFLIPVLFILGTGVADAQNLEQIKDLLDNERYASAENMLEEKLQQQPAEPELNYLMVKAYLGQHKTGDVQKFVEINLATAVANETLPMNQAAYGRYLLSAGRVAEAETVFNRLLEVKQNKKDELLLLAIAEALIDEKTGSAVKALEVLDLAAKRDKKNAAVDILKGNAYRKAGDASNAFLAYKEALEKDPASVKAHYLMGKIFVTQKNSEIYMEHFMKAYQLDSTYVPVLDELYDHYYHRDIREAKKYLQKYIAHADRSAENDYRWTDMLYLSGEYDAAIAAAKRLLGAERDSVQPRLYKLIAYSYQETGDSLQAKDYLEAYFAKEDSSKWIAPDFEFRARLAAKISGEEEKAVVYYIRAAELDSLMENKLKYAVQIADLAKKTKNYPLQANWLGKVYEWKKNSSNVDLFYWGVAHYNAKEYIQADTIFARYTEKYPEHIHGYYWRAQINAAIDTNMEAGLAVPHFEKMIEIGEKDKAVNKAMLIKAYAYLGGYEANIKKAYAKSLTWFEKFLEADPANSDAAKYVDLLKKWIAEGK
jgi:tetratricopeptide (TPR) repeat protein